MGQFNLGNAVDYDLIKSNKCILCHRPGAIPYDGDYERMTYDYTCKTCNSNVVIRITDFVLMGDWLSKIRSNAEVREQLRNEVSACEKGFFSIETGLLDYFFGPSKNKTISFYDWDSGNIAGDIHKYTNVSAEDLDKIHQRQAEILRGRVSARLNALHEDLNNRKKFTIDQDSLVSNEIDAVKNVLIKDRFQFDHKPTPGELVSIGAYNYTYPTLMVIQEMYQKAVGGTLDYNFVPAERQSIAVASLRKKRDNAVEALALGEFLKSLKQGSQRSKTEEENSKFSKDGIKDLEKKIDELKEMISKLQAQDDPDLKSVFYELQAGQEVIFNEIDDLRELIPTLTKKNWKQLLKGKLLDLATKQVLSKESLTWVWKKLSSIDLDLNDQNLLNS